MKGIFFQKPLELELGIVGESWGQGETITGTLKVKNHGAENILLKDFGVRLCLGISKEIKIKSSKAFTQNAQHLFDPTTEVAPGSEVDLSFCFPLTKDAPISEKSQGLYLLCGFKENPFENGMMELKISPYKDIINLLEVFENLLRFKVKSLKNKKNRLEAVMVVPSSKDYSSVQQLKILINMIDNNLDIEFNFKLKKISFEDGVISAKDSKLQVKKLLTPKEYLIYGDAFNQDKVLTLLQEVIEEIKVKPIL